MDDTKLANVLIDIISKTPNTIELNPILRAFAEVADELLKATESTKHD